MGTSTRTSALAISLALAGCNAIFGITAPDVDDDDVTDGTDASDGGDSADDLGDAGDGLLVHAAVRVIAPRNTLDGVPQAPEEQAPLALMPERVIVDGESQELAPVDGDFTFTVPTVGARYRVVYPGPGYTELQDDAPALKIAYRFSGRLGAPRVMPATSLRFQASLVSGERTFAASTGSWVSAEVDLNDDRSVHWDRIGPGGTAGPLLQTPARDALYQLTYTQTVPAADSEWVIKRWGGGSPFAMQDGMRTDASFDLVVPSHDRCLKLGLERAALKTELANAVDNGEVGKSDWGVFAVPSAELPGLGLLPLVFTGSAETVPSTVAFTNPFPGHPTALFLGASVAVSVNASATDPTAAIKSNAGVYLFRTLTDAENPSTCNQSSITLARTVLLPSRTVTVGPTTVTDDYTLAPIPPGADVNVVLHDKLPGAADFYTVVLQRAAVVDTATELTPVGTFVSDTPELVIPRSLFEDGALYLLHVTALAGYPKVGEGNYIDVDATVQQASMPSYLFQVE